MMLIIIYAIIAGGFIAGSDKQPAKLWRVFLAAIWPLVALFYFGMWLGEQ